MKIESIWGGVYKAFYSKAFYEEVAREWEAEPFVYLLWLLALSGLVFSVVFGYQIQRTVKPLFEDLLQQMPPIQIVNGRATAQGPQPLTLRAHVQGKEMPVAVIDTGDHFKSIEETGAPLWLNSHELVVLNKGKKRIRPLSAMKDARIDGVWLREKSVWILKIALAVSLPVLFIMVYAYRLVLSLLYALIGMLCNAFFGARLSFPALWRLSVVAMTPAVLFSALHSVILQKVHIPGIVFFLITFVYLGFAVWANLPEADR